MIQLSGQQRNYLRAHAHSLDPIVLVGKQGVTDTLINAAQQALEAHELIKVKFNDFKKEREALTADICERTGAQTVAIIGNVAILYRQQDDEEKRRIILPE